jgi:hypothetical protein
MSNPLPQIPGYFALRTGADLASSIRGRTVYFDYEPGTLTVADSPGVPVFTSPTAATRPAVAEAQISCGDATLNLSGTQYSALFWSNSAVEKFLLPYFVSAGGNQAYAVLQAIVQAWYCFDADNQACALAFSYPSVPTVGPQQLWDMVQVISWQPATAAAGGTPATPAQLVATPLLTFAQGLGLPEVPDVVPAPQGATLETVSTAPAALESIGAREVAEYVAGLQGQEVRVYQQDGEIYISLSPSEEGTLLFTAMSPAPVPRPPVTVQLLVPSLTVPEQSLLVNGVEPDSAFWTDGAVEMLLLPYYASVEGQWAPWYLAVLLCKWSGMIPPTLTDASGLLRQIPVAMGRAVAGFIEAEILDSFSTTTVVEEYPVIEMPESQVFAIVHLPRSEWVDEHGTVVEAFELEHRTALLTAAGQSPLVSPRRRLIPRRVTG